MGYCLQLHLGILVYSFLVQERTEHFFEWLSSAGLSIWDRKCHIGMAKVTYLGHVFSAAGMEPDPQKVAAVHDSTTPTNMSELWSLLRLASYYWHYTLHFTDITAPLHRLMDKCTPFI